MEKYTVVCPCCEAALTVDAHTGALLAHEEKKKVHGSFEDLKGELNKQKEHREQIFAQEMSSIKDRERLLEEKFKEALKRADTDSDKPFRNPLDLD
ncbi:MAG: 2-nitropropane dioxygenase [Pyrinomonadaceae bacterium]